MATQFLILAAIVAVATFCVHFFVGGRFVAAPLLADHSLPRASKWLNYMTWHIASLYLAVLPFGYAWAAWAGGEEMFIVFVTILNAASALMSVTAARMGRIPPWRFPSTSFLSVLALLGLLALIS